MNGWLRRLVRSFGFDIIRSGSTSAEDFGDLSLEARHVLDTVKPFTLTSGERIASLINAVEYISSNAIPGDIAECGVWKGGSMMAVALTLVARGDFSRDLWLYDTFAGMTEPTNRDVRFDGVPAQSELHQTPRGSGVWCNSPIEEVERNIVSTGYPREKIHLVKGKVEETIPAQIPSNFSLLRLDTDWYESTKHELIHLFPRLAPGGILVLDDYGHWQGARKAVDEFFHELGEKPYLHRVDYTCRILVKSFR